MAYNSGKQQFDPWGAIVFVAVVVAAVVGSVIIVTMGSMK